MGHSIHTFQMWTGLQRPSPAVCLFQTRDKVGLNCTSGLAKRGRTVPWTFICTWPSDAWIKSCAPGGALPRRGHGLHHKGIPQCKCKRELLRLEVSGTFRTVASPSAIGWCSHSVLRLCQDCKIFLMTGHILHLDFMVTTTRSFLCCLVEVIMIQSRVEIATVPR